MCGELLVSVENQQFDTHRLAVTPAERSGAPPRQQRNLNHTPDGRIVTACLRPRLRPELESTHTAKRGWLIGRIAHATTPYLTVTSSSRLRSSIGISTELIDPDRNRTVSPRPERARHTPQQYARNFQSLLPSSGIYTRWTITTKGWILRRFVETYAQTLRRI